MIARSPPPPQLSELIAAADRLQQAGRLGEAEAIYRDILIRDSRAPAALLGLAGIALAVGRPDAAHLLVQRAGGGARGEDEIWNELGVARFAMGDLGSAAQALARAVVLGPGDAAYLYHLGVTRRASGDTAASIKSLARAAAAQPLHPFALGDLAVQWQTVGELDRAGEALRRLLALDPARSGGWHNFGLLLAGRGESRGEALAYGHAIAVDPVFVPSHYNAGCLALSDLDYGQAARHLQAALALDPAHAQAWNNLGCTRREQGRLDTALRAFRHGHAADAGDPSLPSNIAMSLTVLDGPASDSFARAWGAGFPVTPPPIRRPRRGRLRVGYLSPDMRHHSCAYFLEPLFAAHDRNVVEVFAYADVMAPDATTARLQALSDQWRDIAGQDDQTVIGRIIADDIDILVDLAGHTSRNRLRVFAAKPAPVQLSWLGYNATTGLRQIDWKLADRWILPAPGAEWFAERLWPLQGLAHCWRPPADAPDPAPAAPSSGEIFLGSFNALHKLGADTLALWARILSRIPEARLRLKGGAGADRATRARIRDAMAAGGVTPDRVIIENWAAATASHLALYGGIDIALDPFPYNGTTTTCEALWMGVPVVTLAGDRMLSRIGVSLLNAAGLPDLVAASREHYIDIVAALARSPDRRADLRTTLRERLKNSPLRDEAGFARSMEAAYRQMRDAASA